jgi:hypothetical protein
VVVRSTHTCADRELRFDDDDHVGTITVTVDRRRG